MHTEVEVGSGVVYTHVTPSDFLSQFLWAFKAAKALNEIRISV
jgi:hypothetical protein